MGFFDWLFGRSKTSSPRGTAGPAGKLGPPSAGLRQFRTQVADRGDSLDLSGQWLEETFRGQSSVNVMKRGDVKGFLAQTDRKFEWTVAYMHHPDPEMLAQALEAASPLSQLATVEDLAYLVTHGDTNIEEVAIGHFWSAVGEGAYGIFFNILGSGGILPSGVDRERAKWAVQRIHARIPAACPASKKRRFEEQVTKHFGRGVL